ncbi:MAG TPA: right-handed parallel beta-helix repeat-containing protein, partial [bacterium]|nr:right-handed parallel beta-helix repeat-containing protein [bacterium]
MQGTINKNSIIIFILAFLVEVALAETINVSGKVALEGESDHSNIKVLFEAVSPSAIQDSTYTGSDGSYTKNLEVGIYNVHFTKDGFQPQEIPDQFFDENIVLENVSMPVGTVVYVQGSVHGEWASDNIYVVTDSIYVQTGNMLTINPGTKVKFNAGQSLTVSGYLIADGAPDDSIVFTSNQSVPMPADWGSIYINDSPMSLVDHVIYEYASNGINGHGSQSGEMTITNSRFDNLHVDAYGVKLGDNENSNCYGKTNISYNNIKVAGPWLIYTPYAETQGTYIGNYLESTDGSGSGMYIKYSDGMVCDSNTIVTGRCNGYGIDAYDSDNAVVRYNSISGDYLDVGLRLQSSDNCKIIGNQISMEGENYNGGNYGYYLEDSEGDSVLNNLFFAKGELSSIYAFRLNSTNNFYFENNHIEITAENGDNSYWYGFCYGSGHIFLDNTVIIKHDYYNEASAFRSVDNSLIQNNYIEVTSRMYDEDNYDESTAIYGSDNIILNDTLVLGDRTRGIYGHDLTIKDCIIESPNSNNDYEAIYLNGSNNTVQNVDIRNTDRGIYISSASNTLINRNRIQVDSEYGIQANNNSNPNIFKNTIVGDNQGTGILVNNNSNPILRNNHIEDFSTGMEINSTVNQCQYNNLYNISTNFSGTDLPSQIGNFATTNNNDTECDIYWNISENPLFYSHDPQDSLYLEPMGNSPLVNAGYPDSSSSDGTVSDIGAESYFHHLVIQHEQLQSTNNTTGPYSVQAKIYSPQGNSINEAFCYYSTDGGNTFTELSMTNSSQDTFQADIPGQNLNTSIDYYLFASDGSNDLTAPFDTSRTMYSFFITMFTNFANLSASSNSDGTINLAWERPQPISGQLVNLRLYRHTASGVPLDADHLYAEMDDSLTTFTDQNVEEGGSYYYKLTGLVVEN